MAEVTQGELQDQIVSFQGGADSGHQPRLLQPDRCARSVNCCYRGGFLSNRPGFKKWILRYPNNAAWQDQFELGNFQGACFYPDLSYGNPSIMVSSAGSVWQLNLQSAYANVSPISTGWLSSIVDRHYFCVADKYLVVQDGQISPVTWDGAVVTNATTPFSVPVGTLMAYGQGRLFIKVGPNAVRAGDLIGTTATQSDGTTLLGPFSPPLTFTETNYLDEGGDFGPPSWVGDITAMCFTPVQDTDTGQGALIIFGPNGAISSQVNGPRETTFNSQGQILTVGWKDLSTATGGGFITVTLVNNGALGDQSTCVMNGDIWYRAFDGWRSYRSARGQQGNWANTSLSSEMTHRINDESAPLLSYGSAINFDNRLIVTLTPTQIMNGNTVGPLSFPYHMGMMVLDFHPVSSVAITPSPYLQIYMNPYPVWNDLWTGVQPYQILNGSINGQDHAWALVRENGRIQLYEISKNDAFDNFGTVDQPIQSSVDMRAFIFQNDREEKRLYGGDIWFNNLRGDVQVTASFRPDEFLNWYPWYSTLIRTQYKVGPGIGNSPQVFPLQFYQPAFEPRLRLPTPPNTDDTTTGRKTWRGYSFQPRLDIIGSWSISRFRLHCQRLVETAKFDDSYKP